MMDPSGDTTSVASNAQPTSMGSASASLKTSQHDFTGMASAKDSTLLTPQEAGEEVHPLHYAAAMGDKKTVQQMLSSSMASTLVQARDDLGRTALVYAVVSDSFSCAEVLIKRGIDINAVDSEGRTALLWACFHGRHKTLRLLLSAGADPYAADVNGRTGLHLCTNNKNAKCMTILARAYSEADNPCRQDQWGMTPLHWAGYNGTVEQCKVLINKLAARILARDNEGKTPLHWAASAGNLAVFKFLLSAYRQQQGGSAAHVINLSDLEGRTPLHLCIAGGQAKMAAYLLSLTECKHDAQDGLGRTPLHWAAQLGHISIVTNLFERGPEQAFRVDVNGAMPLQYTAYGGHLACLRALLSPRGMEDKPDAFGRTALMIAVSGNHPECVATLVESGKTDVNAIDGEGVPVLHMALHPDQQACFSILLSAGADVDIQDATGRPTILAACEAGNALAVQLLIESSAVINFADETGKTLLHWASMQGQPDVCAILVHQGGLDPNARDDDGRTPAHTAAYAGAADTLRVLIELGCQADIQDDMGVTPMHWAAANGHVDAIQLLLMAGCFPNHMEFHEQRLTPLDYALLGQHQEAVNVLRENGGLCIEEIRNMAAAYVQAWWKGHKCRVGLLGLWQQHSRDASLKKQRPIKAAVDVTRDPRGSGPNKKKKKFVSLADAVVPGEAKLADKASKASPVSPKAKRSPKAARKAASQGISPSRSKTEALNKKSVVPAIGSTASATAESEQVTVAGGDGDETQDAALASAAALLAKLSTSSTAQRTSPSRPESSASMSASQRNPASMRLQDNLSETTRRRQEQSKVKETRRRNEAATVIQRAYRDYKRRRLLTQLRLRREQAEAAQIRLPRASQPNAKLSMPVAASEAQRRRQHREGPLRFRVDPRNTHQQIAALAIQLHWRQYLSRKAEREPEKLDATRTMSKAAASSRDMTPTKQAPPDFAAFSETKRRELRQQIREAQQRRAYASLAPVVQWKPKLAPVARPLDFISMPSPAITSFNMAISTYVEPMLTKQLEKLRKADKILADKKRVAEERLARTEATMRDLMDQERVVNMVNYDATIDVTKPGPRPIPFGSHVSPAQALRAPADVDRAMDRSMMTDHGDNAEDEEDLEIDDELLEAERAMAALESMQ